MRETEEPSAAEDGLARRLRDAHLGSLLAGVALVFVVFKVLAVSHFEITTALGIVAESGTASLVVGALVRTLGLLLVAALLALLVVVADDDTPDVDRRFYRGACWVVTVLAVLLEPPIISLLILALSWLLLGGPGRDHLLAWGLKKQLHRVEEETEKMRQVSAALGKSLEARVPLVKEADAAGKAGEAALADPAITLEEVQAVVERARAAMTRLEQHVNDSSALAGRSKTYLTEREARNRSKAQRLKAVGPLFKKVLRWAALVFAVFAVYGLFLTDQPWLPAQRIVVEGQPAVTGYVLKANPTEIVLLDDGSRQLLRIEGTAVKSRRYCEVGGGTSWFFRPMLSLRYHPPSYSRCSQLAP